MTHATQRPPAAYPSSQRFVENLVHPNAKTTLGPDANPVGYRLGGRAPGPVVVVSGFVASARSVYERMLLLPALPYLRGTLFLIYTDRLDGAADTVLSSARTGPVDDVLFLPYADPDTPSGPGDTNRDVATDGYWAVLGLCARLGMISGRGVPAHALKADPGRFHL